MAAQGKTQKSANRQNVTINSRVEACRSKYGKGLALLRRKPTQPGQPSVGDLPAAFEQLLSNFRQTVTSLSLAFKPPISVDAAVAKLDQLSDELGQIITCVIIVLGESWNLSALGEEWRTGVVAVSDEVDRYLESLQSGRYLEHTGMVWDLLDRMKPVSQTELEAVKRRWKEDMEIIKDAWKEFNEYLEGDEPDDEERNFALAAKPLLAMHQLLHAAVPRHLQKQESYQRLLQASKDMQAAFDTAILAVYDQDEEELDSSLSDLTSISEGFLVNGSFADKWRERYKLEEEKWKSRG